jgi:hypothetical protein
MDLEFLNGVMVPISKEIFKIIRYREKGHLLGQIAKNMMDNGIKI